MKIVKRLLGIIFLFTAMIMLSKTVSATENQYTENVIPKMTSDSTPSGKVSASSITTNTDTPEYFSPFYAFDHELDVYYGWVSDYPYGWLEYEFAEAKCITKYTLVTRHTYGYITEMPKTWTFEAWDNQQSKWIVLDNRQNILDWERLVKKEFTFNNTNSYTRYRINISENGGHTRMSLGELEMMESKTPSIPNNLVATPGDSKVSLTWDTVGGATSYSLKRSEKLGGPYTTIATVSETSYVDLAVTNGITYYYVVSALKAGNESGISNEAAATPVGTTISGNAILNITLDNGTIKEYNLTAMELNDFLNWYENASIGVGKRYYIFNAKGIISPFTSIKTYIPYNKILFFDVKEYIQ